MSLPLHYSFVARVRLSLLLFYILGFLPSALLGRQPPPRTAPQSAFSRWFPDGLVRYRCTCPSKHPSIHPSWRRHTCHSHAECRRRMSPGWAYSFLSATVCANTYTIQEEVALNLPRSSTKVSDEPHRKHSTDVLFRTHPLSPAPAPAPTTT